MARQPFIAPDRTIVVGISTGGWASLAVASRNPVGVRAVVNFSGGRGGHAGGRRNAVCGERSLIEAAEIYGRTARVPTVWFYSRNDSYFGPKLARSMAQAWNGAGGLAALHLLPPYRQDGHDIASDRAGWDAWGGALDEFLGSVNASRIAAGSGSAGGRLLPAPLTASN
jgi:pimeloyl-ACP methyl ester carboxylesterase